MFVNITAVDSKPTGAMRNIILGGDVLVSKYSTLQANNPTIAMQMSDTIILNVTPNKVYLLILKTCPHVNLWLNLLVKYKSGHLSMQFSHSKNEPIPKEQYD